MRFYWATHNGAELDLMILSRGKRLGFEVNYADAPGMTKSMHAALLDLGLEHLWVVYPGTETYQIHERITVVPASQIPALAESLKWGSPCRSALLPPHAT